MNWKNVLVFLFVFLLPIVILYTLTMSEINKYLPSEITIVKEMSYGPVYEIIRGSVTEKIKLKGRFESTETCIVTSSARNNVPIVSEQDEVYVNDILGYEGTKEVLSTCNGIVEKIYMNSEVLIYLIKDIDHLVYEGFTGSEIPINIGDAVVLDKNNGKVVSISNVMTIEGIKYSFKIDNGNYRLNQEAEFIVSTGTSYENVLVIPIDCVYYNTKNSSYVYREVKNTGEVIGEKEIKIGIKDEFYMSAQGLEGGSYCDFEYGKYRSRKNQEYEQSN